MPSVEEVPENLKPFVFHHVEFKKYNGSRGEVPGKCPFCDREKFSVRLDKGFWRCVACEWGDEGGNPSKFIKQLHKFAMETTSESFYAREAKELGVDPETLKTAGFCQHPNTLEPMIAGFNDVDNVGTVYRMIKQPSSVKRRAIPTPQLGHQLFCLTPPFYETSVDTVFICEGWKDPLVLFEAISDKYTAVVGVPGTKTFKEQWSQYFSGMDVNLVFDNDHPKKNKKSKKMETPAGLAGIKRTASILASAVKPPASIKYLDWSNQGEQYSLELENGLDVKDYLQEV